MRKWQIKNFFFKPIFRHPVDVNTNWKNPKLLAHRKEWCDKQLGVFSWMILVKTGLSHGYIWNQPLFYFRRKKDAAAFKLTWYNDTAKE